MTSENDPLATTGLPALIEDGSDTAFRRVVGDVWHVAHRIEAINNLLAARVGLSPPHYSIVMTLVHRSEGMTVGALADTLAVSQPFATREVGQLVKRGFATKRPNPQDGRSSLISLSEKGQATAKDLIRSLRETNDILFEGVTAREFAIFQTFFARTAQKSDIALRYAEFHFGATSGK